MAIRSGFGIIDVKLVYDIALQDFVLTYAQVLQIAPWSRGFVSGHFNTN
jgi:hypothetical protein